MKRILIFLVSILLTGRCLANGGVIEYATTPGAVASKIFTLTVNGQEIFVEKFKDVSYARFAFSGRIDIKVSVANDFKKYTLSPLSYQIPSQKLGNTISFTLNRSRKLILQVEGSDEKLFLFADDPESDIPVLTDRNVINLKDYVTTNKGEKLETQQIQKAIDKTSEVGGVLFVPNGKYLTGTLVLRKNVKLYLESGALIQGSDNINDYNDNGDNKAKTVNYGKGALIYFDKADNAKIYGRGVIAMEGTKIYTTHRLKIRTVNIRYCNNAGISDVILRDAGGFTIHILNSKNILMKGYKIINDLSLPNQDGTDPDGCDGVVVDDVFMYTSDDAIAVKADHQLCKNVLVKNCVFWTVKSALKVGSDPYFDASNIVFRNNDIVYADRALALYTGKGKIDDVQFIDNKSEFVGGNSKRQLIVFQISNAKENDSNPSHAGIGHIRNVRVINYTAYSRSQHASLISGTVGKDGKVYKVSNVHFENLVIEGKKCMTPEDAGITISPKTLPVDPNVPPKDVAKFQVVLKEPVSSVENVTFK